MSSAEKDSPPGIKKDKTRQRINTVLFMLAVTFVFISVLSLIYLFTKDRIQRNETLFLKKAVLFTGGFPIPDNDEEVEALFSRRIEEVRDENRNILYYRVLGDDHEPSVDMKGYVIPARGAGLWGAIDALVGFSTNLDVIIGIDFVKDNETPGLGARINEDWFREQFRGKEGKLSMVDEKSPADSHQFQGITGATITTTAVQNIINKTREKAPEVIR